MKLSKDNTLQLNENEKNLILFALGMELEANYNFLDDESVPNDEEISKAMRFVDKMEKAYVQIMNGIFQLESEEEWYMLYKSFLSTQRIMNDRGMENVDKTSVALELIVLDFRENERREGLN